ncbi:hypothetical protein BG003_009338 [Podila horticola]|nr:hypothetical protein BG003_009338 [Podila horticola]
MDLPVEDFLSYHKGYGKDHGKNHGGDRTKHHKQGHAKDYDYHEDYGHDTGFDYERVNRKMEAVSLDPECGRCVRKLDEYDIVSYV